MFLWCDCQQNDENNKKFAGDLISKNYFVAGACVFEKESSLKSTKHETAEMESICKRNRKF